MVNEVFLVGNLGQDPELKHTSSGTPVTNLSVATNYRWFSKETNEKHDEVEWNRVTVWGKQAEACKEYLAKGRQVYVRGRLRTREWEDKEGVKRYTTEIIAADVKFLGGKEAGGQRASTPPPVSDDELPF